MTKPWEGESSTASGLDLGPPARPTRQGQRGTGKRRRRAGTVDSLFNQKHLNEIDSPTSMTVPHPSGPDRNGTSTGALAPEEHCPAPRWWASWAIYICGDRVAPPKAADLGSCATGTGAPRRRPFLRCVERPQTRPRGLRPRIRDRHGEFGVASDLLH